VLARATALVAEFNHDDTSFERQEHILGLLNGGQIDEPHAKRRKGSKTQMISVVRIDDDAAVCLCRTL
jgi:hypothetical protein